MNWIANLNKSHEVLTSVLNNESDPFFLNHERNSRMNIQSIMPPIAMIAKTQQPKQLAGKLFNRFALLLMLGLLLITSQRGVLADEAKSVLLPDTDEAFEGAGPVRRYDWFRNLWNEKRTTWQKEAAADQGSLVFLGDSITQGWESLPEDFPGIKLANRGISGDTTRGMLYRLQVDVLDLNPTGIVFLGGTNDLEEGATPEVIADNFRLILEAVAAKKPGLPVVVCLVFPASASKARPADKIQAINALYEKVAMAHPNVTVVDTWRLFASADGDAKLDEFPDLLHPNAIGYAKWKKAIRPVLTTLGYAEAQEAWKPEAGFREIFDGKTLAGWSFRDNKTMEILEKFTTEKVTRDGRYLAASNGLAVTTPPEGRRFQILWTTEEFPKNFELRLDFRATPYADSGIFLRGPQLQCRDYLIAGPFTKLEKYRPQEWNEIVVVVKDNVAHCTCNGEVLDATMKLPPNGPIGLEGDRGQMEYRRIRVKELP
jgi:lysophospholipase L1-like esterase